ncbi:YhcN/YlaJ family sporulation lipoprotein [Bacillus alkalicellulosilyticus]|uniref:YhcN/YlaJ family sporulation lipoprotein n=1 Tax=Alkalihalobacterium alkalicellulosilyticum TaxID=1912214 RepID=UPI001483A4B8|nr:YhcN/YlaJ family sporulation lipoprotein [Bacillus alkalicellulosilyticus]
MKKALLTGLCVSCLLATGCQAIGQNSSPLTEGRNTTYNPTGGTNSIIQVDQANQTSEERTKFGYVRHQKAMTQQQGREPEAAYFDRTLLADAISKMAVYIPGVEDCATLVTDKYALIVYDGNQNVENYNQTEQVYLTAASVLPRHYDVYISDNPEMFENIERFGALGSHSPNVDKVLEATINGMINGDGGEMNEPLPENSPQPMM